MCRGLSVRRKKGTAMARIWVVDDEVDIAEHVALVLESGGHAVTLRHALAGVAEDLAESKPDLVVLDVMFPGAPAGGFALARKIRAIPRLLHMPIILLTSINRIFPMDFSADDADPEWMPVQGFIDKPVDGGRLLGEVSRLLGVQPCEQA